MHFQIKKKTKENHHHHEPAAKRAPRALNNKTRKNSNTRTARGAQQNDRKKREISNAERRVGKVHLYLYPGTPSAHALQIKRAVT